MQSDNFNIHQVKHGLELAALAIHQVGIVDLDKCFDLRNPQASDSLECACEGVLRHYSV